MVGRLRRISRTDAAWSALQDAAEYIPADSPRAASEFIEQIISGASSLQTLANRGRIVPELPDPSIRELIVSPFRLIYQVCPDEVYILMLLHEARDFARSGLGSAPRA